MMESHTGSPPWVVDPSSPDCGNEAQPSTAEKFLDRLNIEDQSPMPVQQRLPDIAHVQDLLRLKSNDEDFERDHDILKVLHNHQTQDKETKYPLDQKQKQEREKQSSVKQEVEEQELDQGKLQYPVRPDNQDHRPPKYQETLYNLELGHHDKERLHYPDLDSDQERVHDPELDQDQDQESLDALVKGPVEDDIQHASHQDLTQQHDQALSPDTTQISVQDQSNNLDQVPSENQDTEGKVDHDYTQLHERHNGQAHDLDLGIVRNSDPSPCIDTTQQQDQNKQPVTEQVSSIGPSSPDPTNPDQEPVTDKPCGDETGEPGGGIPAVVITQAQEARELAQVKPGEPEAARLKGPERPQDLIIPAVSVMATGPNPIPISSQGLSPHLSTMTSFSPFPSQGRSPSPCPSLSPGPSPSPCPSLSPGSSPSPSPSLSPGFSDCPSPSPITSPCLSDASDGVDMACSDLLSLRSDSVSLCASEVTISSRGYREQQGQEDDTRSVAASSVMSLFHRIQMEPLEKDWLRSCVLGNTAALRQLLRQDPSLASKKDFITGVSSLFRLSLFILSLLIILIG
ncbi:mediator of RNA polymerase II transcription subunit 15-like isoform X2 [Osmerus eperlanus]|uniref:mediator of RNA polymerase II transcription subunit 15-like isoform X2 n=1 Tax=Osmerus eperlanus TaxID=29151 RepID=UPI002E154E8B